MHDAHMMLQCIMRIQRLPHTNNTRTSLPHNHATPTQYFTPQQPPVICTHTCVHTHVYTRSTHSRSTILPAPSLTMDEPPNIWLASRAQNSNVLDAWTWGGCHTSDVRRQTSHVTRHTSHVTPPPPHSSSPSAESTAPRACGQARLLNCKICV